MRAGPLLYASSTSARTEWYRTQAVLQAPTLTLDLASDPAGSTPFRSFNLRHATVESLPSTTLSKEIVRDLGFEVESESDGVTMYVFEVNLQDEPGGQRKERFASASPWDRGKWVCHLWDAICSANASTYPDFNPPMDEISPVNGTLASKYEDPEFHRLQPPLRVVNVSKLSAFFEANDSQSPSRREHRPSPLQFSTPIDSTTVSAAAYYGLRSAPTAEYPKAGSSTDPYPGPDTPRKTKSVPPTPSVDNLGNLSLVQKRLARLQSQKSSPFHRPTEEEASGSQPRLNGLSTPPISPGKRQQSKPLSTIRVGGDVNNSLGRRETAMSTPTHESRNLSTRIGTDNGTDVRGSSPLPSSPLFHRSVKHLSSKLGEGRTTKTYMTDEESLEHGRRQFNYDAPIMNSTLPIAAQPNTTSQHVAMLRSQDQSSTTTLAEPSLLNVEPSRDYSDFNIAPTLALVKNAALDQAAQTKALALALQSIQEQLSEVKKWGTTAENMYTEKSLAKTKREAESDVKKGVLEIKQKVETVLTSFADRYQQQNGIEAGVEEIRAKLESLTSSDNTIRNLSAANNSSSSNELPFLIQQVSEQLRLNQESEKEGEALLEKISTTVDVVNEGAAADRLIWGTHFAELKDTLSILGTSANTSQLEETLAGIKDALDGLRNDVTSGRKKESEPQLPLPDRSVFSVFRNKPASGQTLAEPAPLDLSALQKKLDAISTTAATPDMAPVNDKLDALLELCREAAEKANVVKMGDEGNTNSKNGTEEGKIDLSGLLSHLQEDQVHREKYYTELNSWLSNTASQTGTQYHAIATQLQALHQLFAPSEDIGGDSLQADGSSDSSRPNNLLREIQNALVENNNRNRTNDNFLAAANHLISTASTERQNLIELIGRQRDENEKLLEKFAETIAMEIRGEKHRFVDAMEKATAINVEAQLQELKGQISVQLISMAKEVERLRDERKSLEHQIAELLTFKNRFGVWNHQIPPTNSSSTAPIRQNPQEPVYLPHTPVHPQSPIAIPPLPTNRRTANHRPLPTPGPNVHYGQPFIPQNGQYL
ncbi:hypothetical protein FRC02_000107 [Tulasnella sp. 418]|nr:hypothetical protein FRC02_000107 [Tulasnella sp. 418]